MAPLFGRVVTAMVTPFTTDNQVNYDEAVRLANHLVDNGTDTVLLAGTTGESPTLTHEEEFNLFKTVIASLQGRAKVMVGTGSNATATAVEMTQRAEDIGADGSLQVVPYYNKPSQEGLFQHFSAVAANTKLPVLLYNIPGRTGTNMAPETMARLSQISNIVGVKEAAGRVDQVTQIRAQTPSDFLIYSGDDGLTLPFMAEGACGVVSVASHCAGREIQDMVRLYGDGQTQEAQQIADKLSPLFEVLFITSNPVPVKAALKMLGFQVGPTRLPLVDATNEETEKVKSVLAQLGLI